MDTEGKDRGLLGQCGIAGQFERTFLLRNEDIRCAVDMVAVDMVAVGLVAVGLVTRCSHCLRVSTSQLTLLCPAET